MLVTLVLACSGSTGILVTLDGHVQDFTTNTGLADARVSLEGASGDPITETTTDESGDWTATVVLPYDSLHGAEVFGGVEHEGHVPTSIHHQLRFRDLGEAEAALVPGRMLAPRALALEPYELAPESDLDGAISGRVFDALVADQAAGIPDLSLVIREGINAPPSSPIVATGTTTSAGSYRISGVPAGTYTAEIDGGNVWSDAQFTVVSVGGAEAANQNGATSLALDDDAFRVVLTWDEEPLDLDSHLTGPANSNLDSSVVENRFHVFFGNQEYPSGSGPEEAVAFLDVDDVSSFGPETVTLRGTERGYYKYSVHDYSNLIVPGSSALSASHAKVQLFIGGRPSETFNIPADRTGTVWTVFELDGRTMTAYRISQFAPTAGDTGAVFF